MGNTWYSWIEAWFSSGAPFPFSPTGQEPEQAADAPDPSPLVEVHDDVLTAEDIEEILGSRLYHTTVQVGDTVEMDDDRQAPVKNTTTNVTTFYIYVSEAICTKLFNRLRLAISPHQRIPLTCAVGDVPSHVDHPADGSPFDDTYVLYLNDREGDLVIGGEAYPIQQGRCYVFSEGMEHSVVGANNSTRWMLGPMTKMGTKVGAITPEIYYINAEGDPPFYTTLYTPTATFADQSIITVYHPELIPSAPNNLFVGWRVFATSDPNNQTYYKIGTIVKAFSPFVDQVAYYVTPVWTVNPGPPKFGPALLALTNQSLYSDNSRVFYKPHTVGGIGSTRNARAKSRKT